ncbi:MAG: hypothetical protein ACYCS7_04545 [Acidimicrobiales bacterium]
MRTDMVRHAMKSSFGSGVSQRCSRVVAGLLGISLLAGACGTSAKAAVTGPTVPSAAAYSPTTTDPYAVPKVITVAYVQKVLDKLDAIGAEAIQNIVSTHQFTPQAADLFKSITTASQFEQQANISVAQIASGLTNYRPAVGPIVDTVQTLLDTSQTCIFVSVKRDPSAMLITRPPVKTQYFVLSSSTPANTLSVHGLSNPTHWRIAFLGYNTDGSQPSDQCHGT